jgi:hypothetical protein
MKLYTPLLVFAFSTMLGCAQINLGNLQEAADKADEMLNGSSGALSEDEIISGLKDALRVGAESAVSTVSIADGFNKDPLIKIPFPEDAQKVKTAAINLGLSQKVEQFETTLNRAAEEASKEAVPVFVDAITSITIQDGMGILKGENNAATKYLDSKTRIALETKFSPIVQSAIEKVSLTSYWEPLAAAYNTSIIFTGGEEIDPDLNAYITSRAIDGLFVYIAKEEKNIRDNPAARITEILQKVFGSL